ncbi:MAG TPA: acyl carrier protein [Vicinamibacteria bacterium]|nr:acyl carrier protein [Vicinamibacteria bacterium]
MSGSPALKLQPEDVCARLLDFVNTGLGLPAGRAVGTEDPLEAAGVDSLAFLKVLLFIETEFGFWVPDEDLVDENIATVSTLARYISCRGAAA